VRTGEIERALTELGGERGYEPFRPEGAVVVCDLATGDVLWASPEARDPAAGGLRAVWTRALLDRLRQLAAAETTGTRAVAVAIAPDGVPGRLVAGRRLALPGGAAVAAALCPVQDAGAMAPISVPEREPPAPFRAAARDDMPDRLAALAGRGRRRFVWSQDAEGRITAASAPLAEVVGAERAAIVGRSWAEIAARHLATGDRLGGGPPLDGQEVLWRLAEPGWVVPVHLTGLAVRSPDGRVEGARGSGVIRTDEIGRDPSALPLALAPAVARPELAPAAAPHDPPPAASSVTLLPQPGERPSLSLSERGALREIARALGARLESDEGEPAAPPMRSAEIVPLPPRSREADLTRLVDRVAVAIAVLRGATPLFANRAFLDRLGFRDLAELAAADAIPAALETAAQDPVAVTARSGEVLRLGATLTAIEWGDAPATLLTLRPAPAEDEAARGRALELELARAEGMRRELARHLELGAVAAARLDPRGRILSFAGATDLLFGLAENEVAGEPVTSLLAPDSHRAALALLDAADGRTRSAPDEGEVVGRMADGSRRRLVMSVAAAGDGPDGFMVAWRERPAPPAPVPAPVAPSAAAQSELLARIGQEVRQPIGGMLGYVDLMLQERFGPIGTERYRSYLEDIRHSGRQMLRLVDDLVALAGATAIDAAASFRPLDLNDVVQDSVARLGQVARRERILIRRSLAADLPPVQGDERSLRQVAHDLVADAIRGAGEGGLVIVSTARTEAGGTVLRVRDTGTNGAGPEARRGLGLPLSRALVEANRGRFSVAPDHEAGTLVEALFPPPLPGVEKAQAEG